MSTKIRLPRGLLSELGARARELKIPRGRLIVRLLEEGLSGCTDWPPGFFERLAAGRAPGEAVDEMLQAIRDNRRSRKLM